MDEYKDYGYYDVPRDQPVDAGDVTHYQEDDDPEHLVGAYTDDVYDDFYKNWD